MRHPRNYYEISKSINKLKSLGAGKKEIDGIFGAFEDMRTEWGEMFGYLGRKMSADDLASFKTGFGFCFSILEITKPLTAANLLKL